MNALEGLKVVDLTTIVSGPYAAAILADLGADVVKVEPPGGENARKFDGGDPRLMMGSLTPHVMNLQRNKRGMVIDLRSAGGKETFADLARWADVVIDNYRPGVAERLGVDYPSLRALNPRVIACSITGYGLTGPGRGRAALDATVQAFAGVMGMTGDPDGDPARAGPLYADLCAGMAGALSVLAALAARERTGEGQQADVAMLDVQMALINYHAVMHLMSGIPTPRTGNEMQLHVPYNAYRASDGWVFIAVTVDAHWRTLTDALNGPNAGLEGAARDAAAPGAGLEGAARDAAASLADPEGAERESAASLTDLDGAARDAAASPRASLEGAARDAAAPRASLEGTARESVASLASLEGAARESAATLTDPAFAGRAGRIANRDRINGALETIIATRTRDEWVTILSDAGIPVAPVNTLDEAVRDPQVRARRMIVDVPHPEGGSYEATGNPFKLSASGEERFTAPPTLGQHTEEILRDVLGYDDARIAQLYADGAVG